MVLRLVDDVKASVREAGAGTLRSLRGLSLRLMDAAQTPAAGEMEVYTPCRSGGGTQSMLEDGAGSRKGGRVGRCAVVLQPGSWQLQLLSKTSLSVLLSRV